MDGRETSDHGPQTTEHKRKNVFLLLYKMTTSMKIKLSIWILVVGFMIGFIGSWMKITHQFFADFVLGISALLKLLGLLLLAIFLFQHPKIKQFLSHDRYSDAFKNDK
jgi:hypothetical protein